LCFAMMQGSYKLIFLKMVIFLRCVCVCVCVCVWVSEWIVKWVSKACLQDWYQNRCSCLYLCALCIGL
jgi:hypothetical protein